MHWPDRWFDPIYNTYKAKVDAMKLRRKQMLHFKNSEVVLSCWNALEHGNKFRKTGLIIPESCPKPVKNTHFREEPRITAVSKLHGRAPNPRARQRGGARARGGWRLPVCGGHFYDFL